MKKITFFSFIILNVYTSVAIGQNTLNRCGTMQSLEKRIQENPIVQSGILTAEKKSADWMASSNMQRNTMVVQIPVVVHVVYNVNNAATQNISDSIVYSQIDQLNNDYRKLNSDTVNIRNEFKGLAADIMVEFKLADFDPDGNPTSGIIRKSTTKTSFLNFASSGIADDVKYSSEGGSDAWDRNKYLNLWSCDMSFLGSTFILGYAQFPGDTAPTDGVVIQYQYFGRTEDAATYPNNLGRTATHEVGHWLGLRHIWGDDDGCDSTDYVDDTPNATKASEQDCNKTKNTCNDSATFFTNDVPDMVENYMDYSTDSCMAMFTKGQSDRMWSFLQTSRSSLLSTGIRAFKEENRQISVYPNPSNGNIKFLIPSSCSNTFVEVFNPVGQRVMSQEISSNALDISNLGIGFYFLKISSGSSVQVKKILLVK